MSRVGISKTQKYGHKLDSLGLLGCVAYKNALFFCGAGSPTQLNTLPTQKCTHTPYYVCWQLDSTGSAVDTK